MCFQEVVEEPATDGDSDHTDRERSFNTKNTCELVVLFFSMLHAVWERAWVQG